MAEEVAPALRQALQRASHQAGIGDGCMDCMAKPGKQPDQPAALRPIGLMSPSAKALAGLLRNTLHNQIKASLRWIPQYAYQPHRDLTDALARVHRWLRDFQAHLDTAGGSRHAKRQREQQTGPQNLAVGGAVLSIDLKQAFDTVSREALTQALRNLGADEATIAAVIAIHDTSCYHIQQQDTATSVRTTRGIRQGCRLAHMLWVVISTAILARLQEPLNGPHRQGPTFADDTCASGSFHISDPEDIHQLTAFLTLLLQVMEDLGLLVNLTKTVLLVRVRG